MSESLKNRAIPYEAIDIAHDSAALQRMESIAGDKHPPILAKGDTYCGDYEAFYEKKHTGSEEDLHKFLTCTG